MNWRKFCTILCLELIAVLSGFLVWQHFTNAAVTLFQQQGGTATSSSQSFNPRPNAIEFDNIITKNIYASTTAGLNFPFTSTSSFLGNVNVSGRTALGTTTAYEVNRVIVVDGVRYPQTCSGVKKAIAAAPSGSTVYLPVGKYQCGASGSLSFGGKSIKLKGAGATSTILFANGVSGGIIYDHTNDNTPSQRPEIEISGITFDVNNQSTVIGVSLGSSRNLSFHDNIIRGSKDIWGMILGTIGGTLGSETQTDIDNSATDNLVFQNNILEDSAHSTYEGFLCVNCRNGRIQGNLFQRITQGAATMALYGYNRNMNVSGNTFNGNSIKSLYIQQSNYIVVDHNNFYSPNTAGTGAHVTIINSANITVQNNSLRYFNDGASSSSGIDVYDSSLTFDSHANYYPNSYGITIRNNIIRGQYTGIRIPSQTGATNNFAQKDIVIQNNQFGDGLYAAVWIGGTKPVTGITRVKISGNTASSTKVFNRGMYTIEGSTSTLSALSDVDISDNYATPSSAGGNSAGVYIDGASNVRVYNNHVEGTAKGSFSDIQVTTQTANVSYSAILKTGWGFGTTTPGLPFAIATSTYIGGQLRVAGSATSTIAGGLNITTGGLNFGLPNCDTLDTNSSGAVICGTDATGAGGTFPFSHTTGYNSTSTTLAFLTQSSLGIGTTTPAAANMFGLGVAGGVNLDSKWIHIGSSTAPQIILGFEGAATTTLVRNNKFALVYSTTTDIGSTTAKGFFWLDSNTGRVNIGNNANSRGALTIADNQGSLPQLAINTNNNDAIDFGQGGVLFNQTNGNFTIRDGFSGKTFSWRNIANTADILTIGYDLGSLALGTTTPHSLFQISGKAPNLLLSDSNTTLGTNARHAFLNWNNGTFSIGTTTDNFTSTSTYLSISHGGFTGISTSTAGRPFAVAGRGYFTGGVQIDATGCDSVDTDSTGKLICGTDATGAGTPVPNIIYRSLNGTKYYTASTSASDNLTFHFNNGFVSHGASSTIASKLELLNQLEIKGGTFAQVQAGDANTDLDLKTITGTGKIMFTPNATDAGYFDANGNFKVISGKVFASSTITQTNTASTSVNAFTGNSYSFTGIASSTNFMKLTAAKGASYGSASLLATEGLLNLTNTNSDGPGLQIYSNHGAGMLGALEIIQQDNTAFDEGLLRLNQAGTCGGCYNIRMDGPTPQIEMVETDQATPAGKFEFGVNGDQFYLSGRNAADSSFEDTFRLDRLANGGALTLYGTATSSFAGGLGVTGGIGVGTTSPWGAFSIEEKAGQILTHQTPLFSVSDQGSSTPFLLIDRKGHIGIATSTFRGNLSLGAGGTATGTAPIVFTPSSLNTSRMQGAVEFNGVSFFGTSNATTTGATARDRFVTRKSFSYDYQPPFIGYNADPNSAASVATNNFAWTLPVEVTHPVTIKGIVLSVGVASGNMDVGIYDVNGVKIASVGATTTPTAATNVHIRFPAAQRILIPAGTYFLAIASDNTTATFTRSAVDGQLGIYSFAASYPLPASLAVSNPTVGQRMFSLVLETTGGLKQ